MKKFISKFIKFIFKAVLIFCAAVLIVLILFFTFPERISSSVMKKIAPEVYYSVGTIAWRKNGADFYGLKVISPGITCNFHRVSFRIKKEKNIHLFVDVCEGNVDYTPVKLGDKKTKTEKVKDKISFFDENPVKIFFTAKKIDFNSLFGIGGAINTDIVFEFPDLLLKKFDCNVGLTGNSIKLGKEITTGNFLSRINLSLNKSIDFKFKPKDKILYYLNAVNGNLKSNTDFINTGKTVINDFVLNAELKSGKIILNETTVNVFEGKVDIDAEISRRKVRGKDKWKFKYDLQLCVTNLNAMKFCNAFEFNRNKLRGNFNGCINTMVFGLSVKSLNGKLQSDNPGILYFPEAEKYIEGMEESMQKQVFDMMVERLKVYPYNYSIVSLKYDLNRKTTEIDFKFSGADEYKFTLFYNQSWIDAIK